MAQTKGRCPHGDSDIRWEPRSDGGVARRCRVCERDRHRRLWRIKNGHPVDGELILPLPERLKARLREEPAPITHDRLGRPVVGPCWIWTGSTNRAGYGTLGYEHKGYLAHRMAYELWRGPIQHTLDHLCRVHACCNPDHLEDVTRVENIKRGDTYLRQTARKHCPQGHPYDEVNTYTRPTKGGGVRRYCRTCIRDRSRRPESE